MTEYVNAVDEINSLRLRITAGEDLSQEEIASGIALLRQQRKGVGGEQTEEKASTIPMDLNNLFKK